MNNEEQMIYEYEVYLQSAIEQNLQEEAVTEQREVPVYHNGEIEFYITL